MTTEEQIKILKQIKEYFSNPRNWTQGAVARNAKGERVIPSNPNAVCYCLIGAIEKFIPPKDAPNFIKQNQIKDFISTVSFNLSGFCPVLVNDDLGYDSVMQLLDESVLFLETGSFSGKPFNFGKLKK